MKRLILLSLLIVASVAAMAQEKVKYRIVYRLDYLSDRKDTTQKTMNWELNIGESTLLFCNMENRLCNEKLDSLNKNNVDLATSLAFLPKLRAQYPNRSNLEVFYNFLNGGTCTIKNTISTDTFCYSDSLPDIKWTLLSDSGKKILDFNCKKASAFVRGRQWTVWYTEDIPFRLGPWLLGGLPGLILAAEDSDGTFKFVCVGMQNNPDQIITLNKKKVISTTKKKFLKLRKEFDEDRIGYELRYYSDKVIKITDEKGNNLTHSKPVYKNYLER